MLDTPCRVWQYRGRGDADGAAPTNKGVKNNESRSL